jgi:phage shock protein PspC (stress-responsive transcriptional regulator)
METKRTLYRNTDNRILGGVASGFAEYMDWDITLVRLALVFAFFTIPGALFAYLLAWIIVPNKYNTSGGFPFGKILLLLFICGLPIILVFVLYGTFVLAVISKIL